MATLKHRKIVIALRTPVDIYKGQKSRSSLITSKSGQVILDIYYKTTSI